jgi:Plasmid pRiA4b ORF-3-like protein
MALFKFRVAWTDDDSIQRDIEILSGQTFYTFHEAIVKAFALKPEWQASFAVLNEAGKRTREVHSAVEKNLRDAPALSCKRTQVGALVTYPNQEFMYAVENDKEWDFTIELITIDKDMYTDERLYPKVVRTEGINPLEMSSSGVKAKASEVEERYDPNETAEGFGDEGDDGDTSTDDSEGAEEAGGEENFDDY